MLSIPLRVLLTRVISYDQLALIEHIFLDNLRPLGATKSKKKKIIFFISESLVLECVWILGVRYSKRDNIWSVVEEFHSRGVLF